MGVAQGAQAFAGALQDAVGGAGVQLPRHQGDQRARPPDRLARLVDAQVHVLVGVQRLDCRQAFLVHQTAEPDTG